MLVKDKTILILFTAGARGDFLATVLLNGDIRTRPGNFFAVRPPLNGYIKCHNTDEVEFDNPKSDINIQIFPPSDAESLIQISYMDFMKNSSANMCYGETLMEKYYFKIRYIMDDHRRANQYTDFFHYRIDYKSLFDVKFLEDLYKNIWGVPLTMSKDIIAENISKQKSWRHSEFSKDLSILEKLIAYDLENNLLSEEISKNFPFHDYMNSGGDDKFLNLDNYNV
jgi:hypothetical protein